MLADTPTPSRYSASASPRRRALSLALALGVGALILAGLLNLGIAPRFARVQEESLTTIGLSETVRQSAQETTAAQSAAPDAQPPQPEQQPQPRKQPTPPPIPGIMPMDLAATDIGRLANHKAPGPAATGADSAAPYGPGDGPQGVPLFRAEWHREPADAELRPYLPAGAPPGAWAEIACRTIENFRVENCQELGESPRGSGLARGLRQAAWQFLVRPPMRGGEPLIGSWVRIHFDFGRARAQE